MAKEEASLINQELEQAGYVGKGKFISPLPEYPGSFTLPYPFVGQDYKAWLRATREKVEDEIEGLTVFVEWRGFMSLLGNWDIDGVERSDLTPDGDNMPEDLKFWCRTCVVVYIAKHYSTETWQSPGGE